MPGWGRQGVPWGATPCQDELAEPTTAARKADVVTTSPAHPSISSTSDRGPLRLAMSPAGAKRSGPLDGAWWPRSRDLTAESVDLVDQFPHAVGRVQRLLFSPPDWDAAPGTPAPRRIHATRGTVKIGSFPRDDTHVMILKMAAGQQLRLLVVASDTAPDVAEAVMARAADQHNTESAHALLGLG